MTETVLWTNPSPNSSYDGNQSITFESGFKFTDYDYIKIEYRPYSGYSNDIILVSPENMSGSRKVNVGLGERMSGWYTRPIELEYPRYINIKSCYALASSTKDDSLCVPIKVSGINL